ncbi:MAG: glycoside hydrolase family 2 protein [Cyclobacteriaceae bacterium]
MLETKHEKSSLVADLVPNRSIELKDNWQFRNADEDQWYPAAIPGNNFSHLFANDLIKDPFYRTNEENLQWVEKTSWEYQLDFDLTEEDLDFSRVQLIFDGLDTYADIYLNDVLILNTNNMFVQWKAEVQDLLVTGSNNLRAYFHSPLTRVADKAKQANILYPAGNDHSDENLSVYSRKAPYHFGWDWGPRFVSSGIWRPVRLDFYKNATIEDIHITQKLSEELADVKAHLEIESIRESEAKLTIECLNDPLGKIDHQFVLHQGANKVSIPFSINQYKKWWPRPMGEAYLYQFKFTLEVEGVAQDSCTRKVGLRTIELVNEPDADGVSFYFKVNDVPFFAKGANYIPQDSFQDSVTASRYERIFQDAVDAKMNMLRVWGGGIYEDDLFYELADENGILIWQDFMFACTMYPGDPAFMDSVSEEATQNIKRLRNHPSIALWCGNNEIEVGWKHWGWQEEFGYTKEQQEQMSNDYDELFRNLLSEKVKELDPDRFYLSSSPISYFSEADMFKVGDNHYWGVWHGEAPFEDFDHSVPRFMSEYGFQSFPMPSSLKKYSLESDWDLESEVMKLHQKHPRGNQLIKEYLLRDYKEPKDFQSFIYASQVLQAEGMKKGIEAHRRNKPFCMGTLYWQLNDCWPVASWSGIDYYGQWKALHYKVRDGYADTLICGTFVEGKIEVFIVSDLIQKQKGEFSVEIADFSGKKIFGHRQKVQIEANTSRKMFCDSISHVLGNNDPKSVYISLSLSIAGEMVSKNIYYLKPPKDLKITPPVITHSVQNCHQTYQVKLLSDVLAKNVYVEFEGEMGNFSDNFFDLLPGEEKVITIPATDITNKFPVLKITTLMDMHKLKA